ncbi:hypothetical protein [Kaarinaea lacus]
MSISGFIAEITNFYHSNTEISIALLVVVVGYALYKPKDIGKMLVGIAILTAVVSVVASLGDTATTSMTAKEKAIHRTDESFKKNY